MSPEIISVYVTNWNNDPWTLGPYSTLGVGGTPDHRRTLGTLITNRLVFAGEHTSVDYPATMHGAYNSGLAAAEQLIRAHTTGSVTIIGAGLSGLAAAQHLHTHGWTVKVLEATAAAGGRARTERLDNGLRVHPGAAWIHGPIGNPIATLADQLGVRYETNWPTRTKHVRTNGTVLIDSEVKQIDAAVSYVHTELESAANKINTDTADTAMANALASALSQIENPKVRSAAKVRLDMHFESLMAADLANLSTRFGDEPYAYPGGDAYITTYLQPIIDHLSHDLQIHFDSPATAVTYSKATGVEVTAQKGQTYVSDACIVTIPLGVLQSGRVTFDPPLPAAHRDALSKLSLGQKCKVFVQFTESWWGDTQQIWIYPSDDKSPQTNRHTEWALWVDASHPQQSDVHVLCCFLGGLAAKRVQLQAESAEGLGELKTELQTALKPLPT
jgi:monoamine oxidase